jgi:hypothetical protein
MGNFHCVPSACAEVVYQPYETGKIRWRYGSEPWQEIIGADDYSLVVSNDLTRNGSYRLIYQQAIILNGSFQGWGGISYFNISGTYNGIQNFCLFEWSVGACLPGNADSIWIGNPNIPANKPRSRSYGVRIWSQGVAYNIFIGTSFGLKLVDLEYRNLSLPQLCKFTVTKKGVTVYQETRSTCPTVEKIPCLVTLTKRSLSIKKLPYLEKVEVVPYEYSTYKLPGVGAPIVQKTLIPPECLNIYNNAIYVVPPSGQGIYPNATPFDSFIAQICSAPGCPPPIYDVICDDCCEKCPDYTCPIECGDEICCYNDYGVSVQVIPKSNFCGGAS